MAISIQQVQRQSQQLIMTPQMQQSIQLLQMNTIELEQLTQQELLENPFLQLDEEGDQSPEADREMEGAESREAEREDDFLSTVEREVGAASEGPDLASVATSSEAPDLPAEVGEPSADTLSLEDRPEHFDEVDFEWDDYEGEGRAGIREEGEEERDFSEYTAARISLYEHLMWQLRLSSLQGRALEIGEYLVGCVNDDGYVDPASVEEAAQKFGVPRLEIERTLKVLQEFEPTGICARSAVECLLIQMRALGSYSTLAELVLTNHFEELQKKKFKAIAKATEADEEKIVAIHHKVARLEPRPGRAYTKDSAQYIEPDVYVKLIDGRLSIYVNEGTGGRLSVNRFYRQMLRLQSSALTREERAYATEKFRGALMLIKNIEKRKSTILRVTEAIMDVQREFLDRGVEALKPLTLREVADMVGMHESTIARVTSKKYVETPQGLFSLKFFFSSAIESTDAGGEAVSSRAIKDKIADMVSREDPTDPLSDQKIAELLKDLNFQIARRTVAKYREALKILPAKLRKQA